MNFLIVPFLFLISVSALAQRTVSREDARQDIAFLRTTLLDVHYNPFLFVSKDRFEQRIQALESSLPDSLTTQEMLVTLSHITSMLQDGHTMPALSQPVLRSLLRSSVFFPYRLLLHENRLYLPQSTAQALAVPKGAELIAVNNHRIADLLPRIDSMIGGRTSYRQEMTMRMFPYYLMIQGITPPFTLAYTQISGDSGTVLLPQGISFKEALTLRLPAITTPYSFRVHNHTLGVLTLNSMSGAFEVMDRFVDSCVTYCNNNSIHHLAIDIRDNSGGNSQLADMLISYWYRGKYTLMGKRLWKVSAQYKQYLLAAGDSSNHYHGHENGSVWELGDCSPQSNRFDNTTVFTGTVYLLTGPFTFSSANMLADGAKQFHLAEILGEETGENTTDFGEVYKFELPKSKIIMQTTTSLDYGVDCSSSHYAPVMPDVLITTPLEKKIDESDAVLEYLLGRIGKK
ncbi:MAG: S41 family peptidase [Candidatus Kapaibacterium sp.]